MMQCDILLVGDSDIANWPKDLYPSILEQQLEQVDDHVSRKSSATPEVGVHSKNNIILSKNEQDERQHIHDDGRIHVPCKYHVSGHHGATVMDVIPKLREQLSIIITQQHKHDQTLKTNPQRRVLIVVFCAGENDLAGETSLQDIMGHFAQLIETCKDTSTTGSSNQQDDNVRPTMLRHFIAIGPKFEPWQDLPGEAWTKFSYQALSKKMEALCKDQQEASSSVNKDDGDSLWHFSFVNCLTMFSLEEPQEKQKHVHQSRADSKYFDPDQLHLSRLGYICWKQVVEGIITHDILSEENKEE